MNLPISASAILLDGCVYVCVCVCVHVCVRACSGARSFDAGKPGGCMYVCLSGWMGGDNRRLNGCVDA